MRALDTEMVKLQRSGKIKYFYYPALSYLNMEDAKKDTPAIACTEGFLIKKNRNYHTFVMTISEKEVGDQMIIPTKNIKKMVKLGRKIFYKKDFDYKRYQT